MKFHDNSDNFLKIQSKCPNSPFTNTRFKVITHDKYGILFVGFPIFFFFFFFGSVNYK